MPLLVAPTTYLEAKDIPQWKLAMKEKYDALMSNKIWSLVDLSAGAKVNSNRCLYITKKKAYSILEKSKSRLVTKRFYKLMV